MEKIDITQKEIDDLYVRLKEEGEKMGYFLNLDIEFTKSLIRGLLVNQKRYGYLACPCRLAIGDRKKDMDIICPCDYRDSDLTEFGCCYCSLYVSKDNFNNKTYKAIPERRKKIISNNADGGNMENKDKIPVWRCKVCGYLCARDNPPDVCPICGVDHDRFERFE